METFADQVRAVVRQRAPHDTLNGADALTSTEDVLFDAIVKGFYA